MSEKEVLYVVISLSFLTGLLFAVIKIQSERKRLMKGGNKETLSCTNELIETTHAFYTNLQESDKRQGREVEQDSEYVTYKLKIFGRLLLVDLNSFLKKKSK